MFKISQALLDARNYEERMVKKIKKAERPQFHLSSCVGWMNDPNGFSYYGDEYHLFYQYHPYNMHWGPMHWGHAVSKDLLHWEHLPAALAPDTEYDSAGCFSGSAVELSDGRHMLMYTGVAKETGEDGSTYDIQTQCIAVGNGRDYEKYIGNPVLDWKDLPAGGSKYDFRDPKVWIMPDGTFRCVIANCTQDEDGKDGTILLCGSKNGFDWKYHKILMSNNKKYGCMWECPDFFPLDGKHVLLLSPQDMIPKGFEYPNGNGTMCFIGAFDNKKEEFMSEYNQAIDYGIDFYAPQTLLTPDGRRIMIGWMQNWDTSNIHSRGQKWFGQMSLPRELSIRDGRLIQKPIRELEELRCNKSEYYRIKFEGITRLKGVKGRKIDMEISLRPADDEKRYHKFEVHFAQDDTYQTIISFCPQDSILKVDRTFSGSRRATAHQRCCRVKDQNGSIKLRVILDRYSAEVFVNDGENVLSTTIYTDQAAQDISFLSDGKVVMDVIKYDLATED